MLRSLGFGLVILCATAVVAAQAPAQEPAPQYPATQQPAGQPAQKPPAPPAPPTQTAQANKVTYTGCLKPGATAESWALENAQMASAKPDEGAVGTSGTAGSKLIFNLSAKPTENLKPHANHKIEVVGTVSQASASGAASGAAPGAAGTPPRQTLNVESFKMVSATCP